MCRYYTLNFLSAVVERKKGKVLNKKTLFWGRGGKLQWRADFAINEWMVPKKRSTKGWSQLAINNPSPKKKSCQKWHPNLKRQIRLDSLESSFWVKIIFSRLQTSCIMRKLIFVYSSTKRKWWNLFLTPPFWKLYIAKLVSLRKTCVLEEGAHGINPGCTLVTYTQVVLDYATQHPWETWLSCCGWVPYPVNPSTSTSQ